MSSYSKYIDIIKEEKIIPVIKIDDIKDTLPLLDALSCGGINIAEITFRSACAQEALALAVRERKNITVGAGTVINAEQAKVAKESGAEFIVSPGFSADVAKYCNEVGMLYIPGCVSPTEIMAALAMGIDIIKFFPASCYGGVKTLKSLAAAFPSVNFIPTGGISKENINEYLAFNKIIACGGSWMVKSNLINNGDFAKITELSKEAKETIK